MPTHSEYAMVSASDRSVILQKFTIGRSPLTVMMLLT